MVSQDLDAVRCTKIGTNCRVSAADDTGTKRLTSLLQLHVPLG